MQPEYMQAVLQLSPPAKWELERKFQLPRKGSMFFRLANIDQARVVLALVRARLWSDAALLVGHSVPVICPPCLLKLRAPIVAARTPDEERIVTWKTSANPRIVSNMLARFNTVKPGMSVQQLLNRGVTRRDIREWIAEGSIKVERIHREKVS